MATNKVLFLSVDYLRDETVINGNVDGEVLEPFIIVAQNLHIEQITGTNLYNKLIADITAGSVTGVYKTLLDDYIQPALLQWSLFECLPFINYNFTNKSISTQDSDNSTAVSLEDVKYLRANIKDVAEYYSTRAIAYLKDNEDSFDELGTNGDDCSDIAASNEAYFSGIQFD